MNHRLLTEGDSNASTLRQGWTDGLPDSTKEILATDAQYFLHQALSTPCLDAVVGASGSYLYTESNHALLDFHGNNVHQVGYAHPHVIEAVTQQLKELAFSPRRYANAPAAKLAERICKLAPMADARLLFAPGASEAVSMALKLARLTTGKYKTLSMYGSFHGATMDALSVGGQSEFTDGLGALLPGAIHVMPYEPQRCLFGCEGTCHLHCLDYIERVFERERDIGLVIVETIRNTDVRIPPPDYYTKLKAICHRHGALLAVDETAIAWGRTGKLFAIEHYGVEPDMVIVGKGLGAGVYPFAGLLVQGALNTVAAQSIGHFTFEKSPVAARAAMAMLDVVEGHQLCAAAVTKGNLFFDLLQQARATTPAVDDIRHMGLLFAVDMIHPDTHLPDAHIAEKALYRALELGMNFKISHGYTLSLSPALIIEETELHRAADVLTQAIREAST